MMRRLWMSGAAAVMAISIAGLSAQTPQNPPTNPPTTQPPTTQPPMTQPPAAPATAQKAETTTIQGCVYKEEAIPGRTPNIAEKAGILEDYILVASTDTSAGTVGTSGTTPPATGAVTPAPKAFKLEKITDDKLQAVVGKRVEVTGRVDAEHKDMAHPPVTGAPAPDKSLGPDKIELPEFEVESLREVEGTCPATPNIRK
jgi:hypothetical protein